MKSGLVGLLLFLTQSVFCQTIKWPETKKQSKVFNEHGGTRTDDYFWLNDSKDSNVINHLKAENAYVKEYMKHTEPLQQKLYDELVARIPGKDESLPVKKNGYWYYSRFEEGQQYSIRERRKNTMAAKPEVVLNVPELAKGHQIYLIRGSEVSPNNALIAYAEDTSGDRRCQLFVKDIAGNKLIGDAIPNTSGSYAWASDNKTLYYVLNDHTVRSYKVMRHQLGADVKTDTEIYSESDSTYSVGLSQSKNNKFIFIRSRSTNTSEERYLKADDPNAKPVLIQPRQVGLEYYTDYNEGDIFHIYTNKNATDFKLVATPINKPSVENWKDIIPANPKAYLQGFEVLKDYYVLQTKENGLTQIRFINRKTNAASNVDFGQEDYVSELYMATDDYATDSIRYYFTSLSTPGSEYMYNLKTGEKKLLKQQKVGGNFNTALYETKRLWSTSADGTKVPVSLVYRKDKFKKDGSNPLLLYAYGSYGANSDPYFSSSIISLLDRGVFYAIAHVRGGQEMGRQWFEDGRLFKKKNTFTDFTDAAQFLINEKYTSADKLFANGVSAGGMLMGAITNMHPELFKGVIAEVPWMDVVTDMYNTDLPLTTLEYDQWGDPNKKDYYDYMMSWSPLDNVRPAKYPAIFATGGLNDTQVPYFSPAKWVAKIRENNLAQTPVLFNVNMGAGHGGESGRYARQKLTALKYAFLLDQLGIKE